MPRSFRNHGAKTTAQSKLARTIRIVLGVLVGLNVIAAVLMVFPPGGSSDSLERDLISLQNQVKQQRATIEQTRQHLSDVEKARAAGDDFLNNYFLKQRTSSVQVVSELVQAASQAQIKERDLTYASELIEGSDSLSLMTITANYEGTWKSLMNLVRQIDLSPKLLIIESMNAAPIQGSNNLAISMKVNAFVREESEAQTALVARIAPENVSENGDRR